MANMKTTTLPSIITFSTFSRDGEYQRTIEIEDSFIILQVGVFPSGTFLAIGYDEKDHSPRLVMLKADGTLLKSLTIPAGDFPKSMISAADAPRHPHAIVPTELVPAGHSIGVVVQNETAFPLLEVTEGGAIRAIRHRRPKGTQIKAIVPSDRDLYVIASPEAEKGDFDGSVYRLNPENGAVLGRFELGEGRQGLDLACVHEGKFLSIDFGDGKIIPLVGSAELLSTVDR
jgi:hypothetical protein